MPQWQVKTVDLGTERSEQLCADGLTVTYRPVAGGWWLALIGDLDIAGVAPLLDVARLVCAAHPDGVPPSADGSGPVEHSEHCVQVDLSALDFVDVAGVGGLVRVHLMVERAGGRLELRGARHQALAVLRWTGADQRLHLLPADGLGEHPA